MKSNSLDDVIIKIRVFLDAMLCRWVCNFRLLGVLGSEDYDDDTTVIRNDWSYRQTDTQTHTHTHTQTNNKNSKNVSSSSSNNNDDDDNDDNDDNNNNNNDDTA